MCLPKKSFPDQIVCVLILDETLQWERESADLLQVIVITDLRGVLVVWGIYKTLTCSTARPFSWRWSILNWTWLEAGEDTRSREIWGQYWKFWCTDAVDAASCDKKSSGADERAMTNEEFFSRCKKYLRMSNAGNTDFTIWLLQSFKLKKMIVRHSSGQTFLPRDDIWQATCLKDLWVAVAGRAFHV